MEFERKIDIFMANYSNHLELTLCNVDIVSYIEDRCLLHKRVQQLRIERRRVANDLLHLTWYAEYAEEGE